MQNPQSPAAAPNVRSTAPVRLPIGVSDFAELVTEGFTFVDKTLLIEEILQTGAKVTLITRPRRFGKTLNLSMLRHFFGPAAASGPKARGLFAGLKIAARPAVMAHQGRYPVIFFSFKDIKPKSFPAFVDAIRVELSTLYYQYPQLLTSTAIEPGRRKDIEALRNKTANLSEMAIALKLLSELLAAHHGERAVILLDEYDTPIQEAYTNGFHDEVLGFMRTLLGAALKDNSCLFKSVITGILKISKENLFSDLNNIDVHTVLDESYSAYFGFTEAEVSGLIAAAALDAQNQKLEVQIKEWYNGYRFGSQVIYNPWSIINCAKHGGELRPYWVHTSGSELLKKLMAKAGADFKNGLERLVQGETATALINPNLVFQDLDGDSISLWSLLLFSGYLTALATRPAGTRIECELAIPNQEIRHLYEDIIRQWFTDTLSLDGYRDFLQSLVRGDVAEFEAMLREYLLRSASFFDTQGRDPEKFYHGLVLGMIIGLRETHVIQSNREAGFGRYDVALIPRAGDLAVILEFKQTRDPAGLQAAAQTALAQIDGRRYAAELQQHAVKNVLAIGLAFCGKEVALAYRSIN